MANTTAYRARDPLLQPYALKHLVLKNAWSDDIVPWLKQLADACHAHGPR